MANVYFLLIAILCCIPAISPLLPWAAVAPVLFVLRCHVMWARVCVRARE